MEFSIIFAVLLAHDLDPDHVDLDDAHNFPTWVTVDEQLHRTRLWRDHYRVMRRINGHQTGQWDAQLAYLKGVENYWMTLWLMSETFGIDASIWRVDRLRDLKKMLGPRLYREGWRPAYFDGEPPKLEPEKPTEGSMVTTPPAGANNG